MKIHLVLIVCGGFVVGSAEAQVSPLFTFPAFENRIPLASTPTNSAVGVSFFNGGIGQSGKTPTPSDGSRWLVNFAFGQPIASAGNPTSFLCDQVTDYHDWLTRYFPDTVYLDPSQAVTKWGLSADPDNDGLSNLMEYASASDPNSPSLRPFAMIWRNTNGVFISYRRRSADPNLQFGVSTSGDLINWNSTGSLLTYQGAIPISSEQEEAIYLDSAPPNSVSNRFFRITVQYVPATQPSITLSSSAAFDGVVVSNSIAFTAQGSNANSCVLGVEFLVNGILVSQMFGPNGNFLWMPVSSGLYQITARITDGFGLTRTSTNFLRAVASDLPPSISNFLLTSPANFHSVAPIFATVAATDPEGDLLGYQLLIDGTATANVQTTSGLSWQPTFAQIGPHAITARVVDRWNLATTQTRNAYVFRTPPTP